ncbi:MAG: hypothetical protein V7774_08880 [Pseudorhizobium pelagicum]|uniref:DUF4376 domain-containing protein n=1 Tax=Pseudorhizobium pelagicum TaxID=1509405 RepID=UPI00346068AE
MIVYQTDYTGDGRFVGLIEADPDPLDEGQFLIPAGAVAVAPPEVEAPGYARWVDDAWEAYTPPAPEPEPEPEPGPPTSADVDREHDRRAAIGKTFAVVGYGDVPLEGSLRTQTVLLALKDTARDLQAAGITDPVLFFTDRDNGDHYLTPAQVMDMVDQGKGYMQALHEAKRMLKGSPPIPSDYADDAHWPPA